MKSFRWWWPLTVPVVFAVVAAAVWVVVLNRDPDAPNQTDYDRIAAMRADPLFQRSDSLNSSTGWWNEVSSSPNRVVDSVNPWPDARPADPTVAQRRAAVAGLVRSMSGWTVLSVRCDQPIRTANGFHSYAWRVFGYRLRDGVPYTVDIMATLNRRLAFQVLVTMTSPAHDDPGVYFSPPPPGVDLAGTCLEQGDPDHPRPPVGRASTLWDGLVPVS